MAKKTRAILFLVFLFIFLSVAPAVVLYSQGYRIDFDNKKISRTGGLFLKIEPKQIEIYLDGKLVKKTNFFFGSVLIENLLPKKYKIEIKKPGFALWEKTLEIKEKEVTEAKNIVLFPENPDFSILAEKIKQFWTSPDQSKIILLEEDKSSSPLSSSKQDSVKEEKKVGWALKLYDLNKNVKSQLIKEEDVSPKGADLLSLSFSEDSKEALLEIGIGEKIKYFTLNLNKVPPALLEEGSPATATENVFASRKVNNDVYYLDKFGYLFRDAEKLNDTPFPIKQETEYALEIFQNFIFLREDKILYQFSSDLKSFEKFFEGVSILEDSPDLKKLVYASDYEIWILFLKDTLEQPQRKAGEKLFIARLSEKIGNCYWLNNNYLVFNSGNKIKISETDDRNKTNVTDIAELKNPEIFWNKIEKRLYVLSEGNLFRSEVLLP
jgi:hypothetical protein